MKIAAMTERASTQRPDAKGAPDLMLHTEALACMAECRGLNMRPLQQSDLDIDGILQHTDTTVISCLEQHRP